MCFQNSSQTDVFCVGEDKNIFNFLEGLENGIWEKIREEGKR